MHALIAVGVSLQLPARSASPSYILLRLLAG